MTKDLNLKTTDAEMRLVCPVCGHFNSHIVDVTNTVGCEDYTDKEFRQGSVRITVECETEERHKTTYIFGEHKGEVFFKTESV